MDMNDSKSNGLLAENTSIPLEDHKAFDDIQNFMLESAMVEPKSAASSLCVGPVDDMGFLSDGGLGPETDVDGLHESKQSPSPMLLTEQDEEDDEEQSLHRAVQAIGNGDTEHETASVGSVDTATAADYNPFGTGVQSSNVLVVESPNALEVDINDSHADIEEEDPTSPSSVSADPVDLSEDHGMDLNVPHVNGTGLGASEYDDHHDGEGGAAYAGDAVDEQQQEDGVEVHQKPALMSEEIVPLMKSIDEPIVNDLLGADAIVDNKLIDQLDSFGISEAIRRQLIEQQVTGAPMHHHEHDEDDDDGQLVLEEKHSELDGAEKEDLHHEKAFDSDYGHDHQSADVKQDDDAGCCEDSEEDEWDYVKVNKQQAQELETTTPSDHAEFGNTKSDDSSAEQQQHRFDQQQDPEEERQVERLLDQQEVEQQKPKEEEKEEEAEVAQYKQNNIDDEQQLPQEPQQHQQQQQQLEENSEPEFDQQPKEEQAVLFDQQELEQQQPEETTAVPSIAENEQQVTDILGDSSAAYSTVPVGVNATDDVISGGGVATEVVNLLNDSKEEIPQPTTAEATPSPLPSDTYEEQQPEEAEERFETQQAEILSSANTMETSMFGGSLSGQSPMSPESPLSPVQDSNLVAQEKDLFGGNAQQDLMMDVHSVSSPADEELNEKHMYETEEKALHLAGAGAAGDMMSWQLNPEAKEFVPPGAPGAGLNVESTPFTPPRMLEHENFKLRDDTIVAQSPRKGAASSLEDMDLPQENDFQTEMDKRPHEFELEAANGVGEPISEQARVMSPLTSPPIFEELREEVVPATNGEDGGLYGQQVDADAVSGDSELLNKVQELPDGEEEVTQQEHQDTFAAAPNVQSPAFGEDVQVNLMETEPSSAKEEQYVEQKETVDESPIQTLGSDFVQDFSQLSFNNGYGTGEPTAYGANPFLQQQEIEAPVAPTVAEDVSPSYDAPSMVKEEIAIEAQLVAPVSESKPMEPVPVEAVSSPTPDPTPALAVTETTPEVAVEEQKPVEDKPLEPATPSQDNASSVAPIAVAAAAATAAVAAVGVAAAAATAASNKTAKPKASAPTAAAKKPSGTASAPAKAAPASKVTASRASTAASSTTTTAAARKPPTSAPLAAKKAPSAATKTTPTMNGGTKEARPASAASTKSTTLSAKTTKPASSKPAVSNNSTTPTSSSVAAARAKASSTASSTTTTKAASATGSSTTRTAPKLSAATGGAGGKPTTTTTTTSSRLSTVGSAARPASASSRPSSAISEKSSSNTTVPSKPATTVKRTVAAKSTVTNGTSVTDGTTKATKTTTSTTTSATSRTSTAPKTSTLTAAKKPATATTDGGKTTGSTTTTTTASKAKSTSLTASSKTGTTTRTSLAPRPAAGAATSPAARKLQNGTAAAPKKMAASPTPIVIRKPGTVAKKEQQQKQQVKEEVASSETVSVTTTTTTTMAVESTIVSEGGGDVPNAAAAIDLLVAQSDQLVPHAM
uniref:Putative ribonuclease e n=1 Tax=Anopheles braziliensis TaxID=58242 RepID=A0A2M3YY83_9DIPT